MDKGWLKAPRSSLEYRAGLGIFIEFAFAKSSISNTILCPCKKCGNTCWLGERDVHEHLICDGFMDGYTSWVHHGESFLSLDPSPSSSPQCGEVDSDNDEIDEMLMEGFGMYDNSALGENDGFEDDFDIDVEAYYKLVNDESQELYSGCKKFSKIQFLVRLLNMKNLWRVSNGFYDELMPLLKEVIPEGEDLPKNFYELKKFVRTIGLGYESIDACKNDFILFRKEFAEATSCPVSKVSRWKSVKTGVDGMRVHKVSQKVVRHSPLKRSLQQMFMSSKTAPDMRWHSEGRTKDGLMRHPVDSPAWKHFDAMHPEFSSETRNIRLALATDCFNPFGNMNLSYSIWPVVLIPYNVPPWLCMKESNCNTPGVTGPGVLTKKLNHQTMLQKYRQHLLCF